jgi:uncharacterized protein YfaS (alpha-2-macroglobulin family)
MTRFAATPAPSLADARLRAYAIYLLARQGIKPAAAISNVEQELSQRHAPQWQSDLAAAYLASTYRLMQRTADADRLIRGVPWSVQMPKPIDPGDYVYYDPVVHDAELLYLQARHFPSRLAGAPPAALETMSRAMSGTGASSLTAAYTLLALDAMAKATAATATLGIAEVGRDDRVQPIALPAGAMPKVAISAAAAKVRVTQSGAPFAYFVVNESGFDRNPPAADVREGLEIVREFVDDKGNPISRVKVGEDFFVRVRIRALTRDRLPQIAVVDLLPAGVEPVLELRPAADSSTPGEDPAMRRERGAAAALPVGLPDRSDWTPEHVSVREDRVILFGEVTRNVGTFTYRVRAASAGLFEVPPAFAEGMYNRTIAALTRGGRLEVIRP